MACIVWYCFVLYCIVLYGIFGIVWYYFVLHCFVLHLGYCMVLHCIVFLLLISFRTVSKSTAEELASHFDCTYLETSAAEDLRSVVLVFHEITRDVIRSRDLQLSMQSLYISEDRSPLLGGVGVGGHGPLSGVGGHSPMGTKRQGHSSKAAKDVQKDLKDAEKKDDSKMVHRRPTTSFKLFNKSFKIFN